MYQVKILILNFFYHVFCRTLSFDCLMKSKIYTFFVDRYRRSDIKGIEDNLINLGFPKRVSSFLSIKESKSKLQRDIYSYWYRISNEKILSKQIESLVLIDRDSKIINSLNNNTSAIAVLHVGNYWETVAKVVKLSQGNGKFIIPILSLNDKKTKRSILSLKIFCKDLVVIDISERASSTKQMAKFIKKGYKLIIFPDLPPSIGAVYFGTPGYGIFFNKKASIASGALNLAKLFKLDLVYLTSLPSEKENNKVIYVETISCKDISVTKNFEVIESVVKENPEHWAYLDRAENYFQHQLSEKELKEKWNF